MATESVTLTEDKAHILVGDRELGSARLDDARRLYVVRFADGLFHGEEPFFVVLFDEYLWVLPDTVTGLDYFLAALAERLAAPGALYRAESPSGPVAWRRRLAGFLPLFPMPRLGCFPLSTLPAWREEGPLALEELPEIAAGAIG